MKILSRAIFREVASSALLGVLLFTFVLFLQRLGSGKLFELVLRNSTDWQTAVYLFFLIVPPTSPFTIPVGVLVGVLIGLSRMSGDNEITALRATGLPAWRVVGPVLTFGFIGFLLTAASTAWLTPWSFRQSTRLMNRALAAQVTAEIQPRVFEEGFPNTVLYVGDVIAGPTVKWRKIFMADLRTGDQRSSNARERSDEPRILLGEEALAVSDLKNNRIQLSMLNGSTYEIGQNPAQDATSFSPRSDLGLQAKEPNEFRRSNNFLEMDTVPLWRYVQSHPRKDTVDARLELHQRIALPFACLLLALVGVPLGVSRRKGGKSAAFVVTVLLAFLYYMSMISLQQIARRGGLPVELAAWGPNLIFVILATVLLSRLEMPGDHDFVGNVQILIDRLWLKWRGGKDQLLHRSAAQAFESGFYKVVRFPGVSVLSTIMDIYVLRTFLFYFVLLLVSFVMMTEVFTFFELLGDIIRNNIEPAKTTTYLLFLSPQLIYQTAPVSVLVGVLVTFGILSKSNEVTAFKACGVSVHRLSMSILLMSLVLSASLFAFDYYYVPEANRKQDALRSEIKGKAPQTYVQPDRKFIFGEGCRIFYYKFLDPVQKVMVSPRVYELDCEKFSMKRMIAAERARWEPSLRRWVFQSGYQRDYKGIHTADYKPFLDSTATFPELTETPDYFLQELIQDKQMNFHQLWNYIQLLQQSGLDTTRLQVQYHKKFAVPLFAFIMALLSIPFAFMTGSRGAMAGVGVSIGIAIAYWTVSSVFEQVGNVGQLPPALAAWSPDALFSLIGAWLLARLRT
ncbi:MAG: LptF/LptG family permease [Planctomycetota bacterium]|nr:LptF/LptG family permease [Planctomycetota bacterium]